MNRLVKVVIDGGPGTGETSIINILKKKYKVLPEEARIVLARDKRFKGKSAEQAKGSAFQEAIWDHELIRYLKLVKENKKELVFFDRGFLDGFVYSKLAGVRIPHERYCQAAGIEYDFVFMVSPLPKKFYSTDKARKESYKDSLKIHNLLVKIYEDFGYKVIKVPFDTVENRVKFILNYLKKKVH